MGRRESARFRRRRQAWWEVQSGATAREAPDEETQRELVTAIDRKRSQAFGIERLARLQLDGGAPAPAWVSRTNDDGTLSLLRYASLRGRERIVGMLLRGGASLACWACDGENVDMESLTLLPVQDASRCLVLAARFAEAATEVRVAEARGGPAEAVVGRMRLRRGRRGPLRPPRGAAALRRVRAVPGVRC